LLALKKTGDWIHYYDFEHAKKNENPIAKIKQRVTEKLESLYAVFEVPHGRVVRTTGPNWYQIVLDIQVKLEKEGQAIRTKCPGMCDGKGY
jgi:tRNA G37 N-methylase Trm5